MAMPLGQQQQPYNSHSSHACYGPLIAVLLVVLILGIMACTIARLCKHIGDGHYETESWIERKCSACIDGRIGSPQHQQPQSPRNPTA
ncbi:hypothetical protein V6N11_060364 [Hibiscus sabdariffa]|uniref:Uncharacterized protein n=1 Tax=Hibiscus sabdariffa TaxID=183260 RepID=A0ABR2QQF5_9ROSI